MPVYLDLADLIVDEKNKGGITQFRLDYINEKQARNQEDDELFLIARMNADDFDIPSLVSNGLNYNESTHSSNDFVIFTRLEQRLRHVDWLYDNLIYAWHKCTSNEQINRANEVAETNVDKIIEAANKGEVLLKIIKTKK